MDFRDFDHFYSVFRDSGRDYSELDPKTGLPRKVDLNDWLKGGSLQLNKFKSESRLTQRDTIMTPDISPWLPQVIRRNVLEAMEPRLVLTQLFERMAYEAGQAIEFPAVGAVTAKRVAEGQQYPWVRLQESGGTVTASTGKFGIAFRITDEARRRSQFDLVGLHLRACGRALARLKEEYAADMLTSLGSVAFDNLSPATSYFGVTTGRSLSGAANGSLTLDNLLDTFLQVMQNGFRPDTLIMNPLSFIMFLKDEVLRTIMLAGGNQVWYGGWTGNPSMQRAGSRTHVSGGQNITPSGSLVGTASPTADYNTAIDSAPMMPKYWPWPIKIVVSPWIHFDARTKRTDIIVADSSELGLYIEEYPVQVDQWEDLERDVTSYKLKEGYGFHILNEGLGISTIKNVKMVANEIALPARATQTVSGTIDTINPLTAV